MEGMRHGALSREVKEGFLEQVAGSQDLPPRGLAWGRVSEGNSTYTELRVVTRGHPGRQGPDHRAQRAPKDLILFKV